MHRSARMLAGLLAALFIASAPAEAASSDRVNDAFAAAQRWTDRFLDQAEQAIVLGGMLVGRNPNTASGALLGCAAGIGLGAGAVAGLAVPSGGASLSGAPGALALGCMLGGAGGAAMGYQLDHPAAFQ